MKRLELIRHLADLDKVGVCVFSKGDIEKMFPDEQEKALEKSLHRMVLDGLLVRACKGIYVNPAAASAKKGYLVEQIAKTLRSGFFSYVSLESILSEHGVISQAPVGRVTLMTTGARGVYETPYGTIEFTHTKRRPLDIVKRTVSMDGRPLRVARKLAAIQDLKRAGRNVNMMLAEEMGPDEDEERDHGQAGLQSTGGSGDDSARVGDDAAGGGKGNSSLRHLSRS
jgi:hypothetical protein